MPKAPAKFNQKNLLVMIYDIVLFLLFWVIISFLIYICARSISAVDTLEVTFFLKGSPITHVAALIGLIALLFVMKRNEFLSGLKTKIEENERYCFVISNVLLGLIFALSLLFVFSSGAAPCSDQRFVQEAAADFASGHYESLEAGGYLHTYPNQLGLVWISYVFFSIFGFGNYLAFRIFNALCLTWFYKRLSDMTGFFCDGKALPRLFVLLTGVLFYPLQMYCTFIYGTIPGLALAVASFYRAFLFIRDQKAGDCVLSVAAICLSMFFKQNYLIFFIALFVHAVVSALRSRKYIIFLLPVLLIIAYPLQSRLPYTLTAAASGVAPSSGASPYSWIAMGLQDGGLAEGWYNGYNKDTFEASGYDTQSQADEAINEINARLAYFRKKPHDAVGFFTRKLASEWNSPDFEAYWILRPKKGDAASSSLLLSFIGVKGSLFGIRLLSHLEFLILAGALFFIVLYDGEDRGYALLPVVTFIGGFLFHVIWEAKPQYTLVYFVLLFPLAVMGYHLLIKRAPGLIRERNTGMCLKLIIPIILFCILYSGSIGKNLTTDTDAYVNTIEREYSEAP